MTGDPTPRMLHRPRILVLDDEEQVREMVSRVLRNAGYEYLAVGDLGAARAAMVEQPFDLALCDITLGGESGLDLVREINHNLVDVAIVMVTGIDDPGVAGTALTLGAYGYLVKPFTPNEILIQVDGALRRRELERVRRFHVEELESKILERSTSLRTAFGQLENIERDVGRVHREMADRLTSALSLRDEETGRHIERVGRYAVLLSTLAGISEWPDDELLVAAMLHDVGKIAVPDLVLLKPGPLSDNEAATMRRHAEAGYRLLDGASARIVQRGATVALTHHERWDGTGYPQGLAREQIPIEGRITAVVDAFDAMTSERVYRPAMPVGMAVDIMQGERGLQFDPRLLDVFLGNLEEFVAIREELADHKPEPATICVLLADDHTMFAETTVRILDRVSGISVLGIGTSVGEALTRCEVTLPDVVVSEWRLPDGTAADLARALRSVGAQTAVVVLTDTWDDGTLLAALDAGCAGCVGKHRPFEDLVAAVRAAAAGEPVVAPGHLVALLRRLRPQGVAASTELTDREREVLALLAQGLSSEAIAGRLSISVHTARNHSQRIIQKLGAHSRLEAVATGVRAGLVTR